MRQLIIILIMLGLTAVLACQDADETKGEREHVLLLESAWESYQEAEITNEKRTACLNDVACDIFSLQVGADALQTKSLELLRQEANNVPYDKWPSGLAEVLQNVSE